MTSQQELDEKLLAVRSRVIYRIAARLGCRPDLTFVLDQMRTRSDREVLEALIDEQESFFKRILSRFRRWR